MHRRFIPILTAIVACAAVGVAHTRQAAPPLTITFDGGNAFIRTGKGRGPLVVGAITPSQPVHHYNMHRMRLALKEGAVTAGPNTTYTPLTLPSVGKHWDLAGYVVTLCPEGVCPTNGSVTIPPSSVGALACGQTGGDSGLIPDLTAMHGGALAIKDWRSRLDSELTLYSGTLTARSALDCFDLKDAAGNSAERRVASRGEEIIWTAPAPGPRFVDVVFTPRHGGAQRRARIEDDGHGIAMRIWTLAPDGTYKDPGVGDEIGHFQQFYDLLGVTRSQRHRLYLKKIGGVTPGTECPPAMLTAS